MPHIGGVLRRSCAVFVAGMMEPGETVTAFAARVGVSRVTVYKWLRGEWATFRLASVVKLAAIASDEQVRRLYAAVGLRLPACEQCLWAKWAKPGPWYSAEIPRFEEGE